MTSFPRHLTNTRPAFPLLAPGGSVGGDFPSAAGVLLPHQRAALFFSGDTMKTILATIRDAGGLVLFAALIALIFYDLVLLAEVLS